MSSFNRVTLMGNLTRDPELKRTKSGATLTELGMAMNRSWTNENGQRHDETTFVDVTVWGKQAENAAKYLQKGRSVLIEGRLQLDSWQDTNTGQNRSRLRVVAESVQFLNSHQLSRTAPNRWGQILRVSMHGILARLAAVPRTTQGEFHQWDGKLPECVVT